MQTCSLSSSLKTNEGLQLPPVGKKYTTKQATTIKKVPEPKCKWTANEEECLIQFLVSQIASAADGGTLKQVTWNAAVAEMAKVPTKGPEKTVDRV